MHAFRVHRSTEDKNKLSIWQPRGNSDFGKVAVRRPCSTFHSVRTGCADPWYNHGTTTKRLQCLNVNQNMYFTVEKVTLT